MTAHAPVPVRQRVLAGVLLLTLLATGYTLIIEPLSAVRTRLDASIAVRTQQLDKLKALARPDPTAHDIRTPMNELAFLGASAATASAAFQTRVRELVQQAGGTVVALEATETALGAAVISLGLTVQTRETHRGLAQILLTLAQARPRLTLDKLTVFADNADPGAAIEPRLAATLTLSAVAVVTPP